MIPKPIYIETQEKWEVIVATIQAATPVNGLLWNFLTEQRIQDNTGMDVRECDRIEGVRRFCRMWQDIAADKREG